MLPAMRSLMALALALALGAPSVAEAEEWPASVKGLKVVVPRARGKRAWGRDRVTKAVRKTMKSALGELVSPKALSKAQRKLRLKGSKRYTDKNLARAGREAGAQWVLDVRITKKKWLYTATARLINTETGEEQMNFRSQFYKPSKEGRDRGDRIGKRTVQKLDTLTREGPLPSLKPDDADRPRPGDPVAVAPPTDFSKDDVGTPPPAPPRPDTPRPPDDEPGGRPSESGSSGQASASASGSGSSGASTTATTRLPPPPPGDDDTELLRLSLTAGAGLLRNYTLSSDAVASSVLSYNLNPLSLVQADAEIIVPSVPVTAIVKAAFRPVGYTSGPRGAEQRVSGTLLDVGLMAGYHLPIVGKGRTAIRLIPLVGARLALSSVGDDPSGILLASTMIVVQGGLLARLPINETLELDLGVDGGWIASYSESPATSGESGAGFTVAGDLGARIWLSESIAVAFDSRFTYEQIGFSGIPTRVTPASEQANLQNVSISMRDLRASIGVAFRL